MWIGPIVVVLESPRLTDDDVNGDVPRVSQGGRFVSVCVPRLA